ncbi:MAG: 1-acyl-sn-glycerol-3-phosphate acyltransferase [Acidobacteria bacterium]|nr:MAG: 1-acyl-sn-glycerol-3-phosphate acyltransferase [Acidobacteriota bacterium]
MDSWHYQPTGDFDKAPIERLKNFPRHPDLLVYTVRSVANLAMRAFLRTWNRFAVTGRENLPRTGSFIVVANHSSHLDAPAILAALPMRQIHRAFPAAASDYFFTSLSKIAFSAVIINAMPFDRKENPRQSIDLCRQLLEAPGHILILFPEGTRSFDGAIGAFKPGVGFLTAGTRFQVVPCYLEGASKAWPKGKWFPRPRKLRLRIGAPATFHDKSATKEDAIAIAAALRDAVLALERSI